MGAVAGRGDLLGPAVIAVAGPADDLLEDARQQFPHRHRLGHDRPPDQRPKPPTAMTCAEVSAGGDPGQPAAMRFAMLLVAVAQTAVVVVWGYQLLRDQRRPNSQRWVPRHWTTFISIQGVLAVAAFILAFRLGD